MKRSSPNHATSWFEVKRPIVCLAPMDGVTNSAYRQIVRSLSKDVILFSEFTSVDGLVRSEHVRLRLDYEPCEHPFFMQLFGNSPEIFAEASRMVEERGIWGVDINMGCPAKKIVHSQHGSALMQNPDAACRIVEEIRKACSLEVSVKTRLGWKDEKNLITFAKALESAGASMLTIHGRTYNQAFKGESDWQPIYELKRHLTIPVIGNGDIRSGQLFGVAAVPRDPLDGGFVPLVVNFVPAGAADRGVGIVVDFALIDDGNVFIQQADQAAN